MDYEQIQEYEEILNSDYEELKELAKDEIGDLRDSLTAQEEALKILLI